MCSLSVCTSLVLICSDLIMTAPNRIVSDLVEDALSEVAYDAYLAGFDYDVTNYRRGMQISVSGYSDKLDVVVGTITRYFRDLQVDLKKLDVVKEQVSVKPSG